MKTNEPTAAEIAQEIFEEFKKVTEGRTVEEKKDVWVQFLEMVDEQERQRKTPH